MFLTEGFLPEELLEEEKKRAQEVLNEGIEQLNFYRGLLVHLGSHGSARVKAIFANANTVIKQGQHLYLASEVNGLEVIDIAVGHAHRVTDSVFVHHRVTRRINERVKDSQSRCVDESHAITADGGVLGDFKPKVRPSEHRR
jgi:hypothetical protein